MAGFGRKEIINALPANTLTFWSKIDSDLSATCQIFPNFEKNRIQNTENTRSPPPPRVEYFQFSGVAIFLQDFISVWCVCARACL